MTSNTTVNGPFSAKHLVQALLGFVQGDVEQLVGILAHPAAVNFLPMALVETAENGHAHCVKALLAHMGEESVVAVLSNEFIAARKNTSKWSVLEHTVPYVSEGGFENFFRTVRTSGTVDEVTDVWRMRGAELTPTLAAAFVWDALVNGNTDLVDLYARAADMEVLAQLARDHGGHWRRAQQQACQMVTQKRLTEAVAPLGTPAKQRSL